MHPFVGGGIAPIVRATLGVLSEHAEVTLLTTAAHRREYEALQLKGRLYPPGVRVHFVEEPRLDAARFYSWTQAWSDAVYRALPEAFPDQAPDLIEFPDYLAEGFVTVQAKRTGDPWLAGTTVAVRTHTTSEIVTVLNGHQVADNEMRSLFDMERYCLARADRLLWPGGDVLDTYRRFYGRDALAPATCLPDAFFIEGPETRPRPVSSDGGLRILYLGRFERRKGVLNLINALTDLPEEDWSLTLIGGDTPTGPLATSMRSIIELQVAGDDRITLSPPVARSEVAGAIAAHDVVVVPSIWECWPNVAREALFHGRPVIGTPVGGLVAMLRDPRAGWLARDNGVEGLRRVLRPLVSDPARVRELAASGGPRKAFDEIADDERIRAGYVAVVEDGAAERERRVPRERRPPLVSVIVPYHRLSPYVGETLDSIAAQGYPRIETIVVNDGSFAIDDEELERQADRLPIRLVTQPNRGLSAARNFGIAVARGRYVVPLDADDMIEPDFVESCVEALDCDNDIVYVGSWSTFVHDDGTPIDGAEPGYAPLGNWASTTMCENVAGSATSLFRRWIFDNGFGYCEELTSYEDWLLFRELRSAGLFGSIIPRPLLRYRIRAASMLRATGAPNRERIAEEVSALQTRREMQWTSRNA